MNQCAPLELGYLGHRGRQLGQDRGQMMNSKGFTQDWPHCAHLKESSGSFQTPEK